MAPFFVADPSAVAESRMTSPYHLYMRRHEPDIVFGSIRPGVANPMREDGLTLLDEIWSGAPFTNHRRFVAAVTTIAGAWQKAGRLSAQESKTVIDAAGKAERELRTER